MLVSVVIPTLDRPKQLQRLLASLWAQQGVGPFEVVVADDGSTPPAEVGPVPDDVDVRVVRSEVRTGPARARNRGWRAARGEVVAFIDDDCVAAPGWLAALLGGLADVDVAVGRTRPPVDQMGELGPFSSMLDIGHDGSFATCNIAYRRWVLDVTRGFDEVAFPFPNGEDADLGLRARGEGASDAFVAEAVVWHDIRPSSWVAHVRRMRYLDGIVALVARHPGYRRTLDAGWFLRSVDKAVLLSWVSLLALGAKPRSRATRWALLPTVAAYVYGFDRSHYPARSKKELLRSIPLGYVADSYAVFVMARSSIRHRTLLL